MSSVASPRSGSRSVRYKSDGSYATRVGSESGLPAVEELPLLNGIRATEVLSMYLESLPTRSWIGKVLWDHITAQEDKTPDLIMLARRIWIRLMSLERLAIDVNYQLLMPSSSKQPMRVLSQSINEHWKRLNRLLTKFFVQFVRGNPAVLNNRLLPPARLVMLALEQSLKKTSSRNLWETFLDLSPDESKAADSRSILNNGCTI